MILNESFLSYTDKDHILPLLEMYCHLCKEDQNLIADHLDQLLGDKKYSMTFYFPESYPGSGEVLNQTSFLYRMMRKLNYKIALYNTFTDTIYLDRLYIAKDYVYMVEELADGNFRDNLAVTLIMAVSRIEITGLSSIPSIISSIGAILISKRIYDMNTLFHAIRETRSMALEMNSFVKTTCMVGGGTDIAKEFKDITTNDYYNAEYLLTSMEYYLDGSDNEEDHFNLLNTIYFICQMYNFTLNLRDDSTRQVVYDSYLMTVIKHLYAAVGESRIKKYFNDIFDLFHAESMSEIDNEMLGNIGQSFEIANSNEILPRERVDVYAPEYKDTLSIEERVDYDLAQSVDMDELVYSMSEKTGVQVNSITVSLNITEEHLAMYLAEFNIENPLIFDPDGKQFNYLIKYDGKFYGLFEVNGPKNGLYAVRREYGTHKETLDFEILQIKKADHIDYIFKY